MTRPSWNETWLACAIVIGRRSRCVNAQVGAVIVSRNGRVASTGYNGPAAEYQPQNGTCDTFCPRAMGTAERGANYDACPSIHAEANALLYVDRSQVEGGTILVSGATCMSCAKLISNSGLARLVHIVHESDAHRAPDLVEDYLHFCNVLVTRYAPLTPPRGTLEMIATRTT